MNVSVTETLCLDHDQIIGEKFPKKQKAGPLPYGRRSTNSLRSYLFERRAVMNFAILRSAAGPLKNFAVLLSYETVGNFAAHRGPPILADVVKVIAQFTGAYNVDSMRRHFDP